MSDLLPRFMRFTESHQLVRAGERVLVALSGGVDSVVLLHLLMRSVDTFRVQVHAAHLDHAMRSDSAADAEWVAELCEEWQIPLTSKRTTRTLANESDAREARYAFLYQTARDHDCARIATAHHADDQVETVLFRLLRGTGLRGLAGIPVKRDMLIRPLLRFRKSELMEYAQEHELSYRDDASNQDLRHARNRIREVVIPALESAQANTRASVLALARYAARMERAWERALAHLEKEVVLSADNDVFQLARPVLLGYDADLRARVIRHLLKRFGVVPGRAQTRHIMDFIENAESGAALVLPRHVRLERNFDRIRVERERDGDSTDVFADITSPEGKAEVTLAGKRYIVAWTNLSHTPLEIRSWRAGDRIRLPYGTRKLKKLFAEHRIDASQRASIPVIADLNGHVLSVVGIARSVDSDAVLNITVTNA